MTDIATAREEIQAQREALMVGRHVGYAAHRPGEGCLVLRVESPGKSVVMSCLASYRAIEWAAVRLGFRWEESRPRLNDYRYADGYPGLTASQAIAILDEALLVLKEVEASPPQKEAT